MSNFFNTVSNSTLGNSQSASAGAFFASLGTGSIAFGVQLAVFLLIKDKLPRLYQPRSYLVPENERSDRPPGGLFRWIRPVWKTSNVDIVRKCGLDAYFFLRYLAMLMRIFFPLVFTVVPILLCVNSIGGRGEQYYQQEPYSLNATNWINQTQAGIGILTWGNVRPDQAHRYWAHLILAVGVIAWTLYVFYDELRGYIRLRQAYLLSPRHRIRASATTVLVQAIPNKWCTREALEGLFDAYPGGIRNIWINRNYDDLLQQVKDRNHLASKLESAETELIRKCRKVQVQRVEKQAKESGQSLSRKKKKAAILEETARAEKLATNKSEKEAHEDDSDEAPLSSDVASPGETAPDGETSVPSTGTSEDRKLSTTSKVDSRIDKPGKVVSREDYCNSAYDATNDGEPVWKRYLQQKDRPTMRLPPWGQGWLSWLPFAGEQVDTIDHCRRELARLNQIIEERQAHPESYPLMHSAFIQFNLQIAAHMACQSVTHHVPDQMSPRIVEISPGDVIWENMSFTWWERWLRTCIVIGIIAALIIAYAIPMGVVGLMSQLKTLSENYSWLGWIQRIPDAIVKALQGILPPALTGLLLLLVPLFMRFLSRLKGTPTGMLVEMDVSDYYFVFSFVEVFLVITIASGVLTLISSFNVTAIPTLLASKIPNASNYYISYLLLQGLGNSASSLLQIVTLALWFLWAPIADSTPREKWQRQINLPTVTWGSFFPAFTNLACIGLIYSVVAPLMIIFNLLGFTAFWAAYRYLTIYVNTFKFDTGGLLFPKAINQLFTGLYVMEICLIGLFFLVQGVNPETGNPEGTPCAAQGGIMIAVFILTIGFQVRLNLSFGKLFEYLPITLEDEAAERDETFALLQRKKFGTTYEDAEAEGEAHPPAEAMPRREKLDTGDERESDPAPGSSNEPQKAQRRYEHDAIAAAIQKNEEDDGEKILYDNIATRGVMGIAKHPLKAVGVAKNHLDKGIDAINAQQRNLRQQLNLDLPANVEATLNSHGALSDALFTGMHSSLDELSPEERDRLTQKAFTHSALRARRPVLWIPEDELGVAEDEVKRTKRFSKYLEITSDGTALNGKGQVIFGRSPPDFNDEDLIEL